MPINYERLLNWKIEDRVQSYSERDCIIYALGIGMGTDPNDHKQVRFVHERELEVFPTMPFVLGDPITWLSECDAGVSYNHVVLAGNRLTIHERLASRGKIVSQARVVSVIDKGPGKGAVITTERAIRDLEKKTLLATVELTLFALKDGGFGGPAQKSAPSVPYPERAPDWIVQRPTSKQGALIYRLSGDVNEVHVSPAVAREVGFQGTILHGLATLGASIGAVSEAARLADPWTIGSVSARYSAPVYPGDNLEIRVWKDSDSFRFRVVCLERSTPVIEQGLARLKSG